MTIYRDPKAIIDAVIQVTGVPLEHLQSQSRHPEVVFARRLAVALLRSHSLLSFPEINKLLRGSSRNHSVAIGMARAATAHKIALHAAYGAALRVLDIDPTPEARRTG